MMWKWYLCLESGECIEIPYTGEDREEAFHEASQLYRACTGGELPTRAYILSSITEAA